MPVLLELPPPSPLQCSMFDSNSTPRRSSLVALPVRSAFSLLAMMPLRSTSISEAICFILRLVFVGKYLHETRPL
jgi:hypothetical protein